jgi:nicotinamide riboside kinase
MNCIIIGIAGGTGSGKSTFTNRLKDAFCENIAVLYHDNYYKRQDGVPFEERKKMNYDHPEHLRQSFCSISWLHCEAESQWSVRFMIIPNTIVLTSSLK